MMNRGVVDEEGNDEALLVALGYDNGGRRWMLCLVRRSIDVGRHRKLSIGAQSKARPRVCEEICLCLSLA